MLEWLKKKYYLHFDLIITVILITILLLYIFNTDNVTIGMCVDALLVEFFLYYYKSTYLKRIVRFVYYSPLDALFMLAIIVFMYKSIKGIFDCFD